MSLSSAKFFVDCADYHCRLENQLVGGHGYLQTLNLGSEFVFKKMDFNIIQEFSLIFPRFGENLQVFIFKKKSKFAEYRCEKIKKKSP